MPSLIPGFEYDIFISYRHKDNKGQHWVTEFVDALRTELEATFKEDVSIYFDENPHDGLLETHNVDKSLEGKLKCRIFIPILSQTYCDQKSFAWQHEFCAFNKLAKEDQFGRDIKLSNGNVASRILPLKIHELDAEDKLTIENETGGVVRAIEFIYKEPGVNRPLKSTDAKFDNQNKTDYRNQVNKVANAIKETINSLKNPAAQPARPTINQLPATPGPNKRERSFAIVIGSLLLAVAGYFLYLKFISPTQPIEVIDKSVAVLAFADMSPGRDQEWFTDGLTEEILNSLAKLNELKVTGRTSSFYFKGKDVSLKEIAAKLGVAHVVEGSVRKLDNRLRIKAQLIRASDGFNIWSESYDRTTDDLFDVQTDIAESIAKALLKEFSESDKTSIISDKPSNKEAYEFFLKGSFFHEKFRSTFREEDFSRAESQFRRAIASDPTYAAAYGELANLYDTHRFDEIKKYTNLRDSLADIAYRLNPKSTSVLRVKSYCFTNRTDPLFDSAFFYLKKAYLINPDDPWVNKTVGDFYFAVGLPDLANKFRIKAMESDPLSPTHLSNIAESQNFIGNEALTMKYLQKALELDPGNVMANIFLSVVAVQNKDEKELKSIIRKLRTLETSSTKFAVDRVEGQYLALTGNVEGGLKLQRNSYDRFLIFYLINDRKNMLVTLDSAIAEDPSISYPELIHNKFYNPIRETQRFKQILLTAKERDAVIRKKYAAFN